MKETQPALIALAATLSTGPVGVGDGIGFSDPTLIMRLVFTYVHMYVVTDYLFHHNRMG